MPTSSELVTLPTVPCAQHARATVRWEDGGVVRRLGTLRNQGSRGADGRSASLATDIGK
jgi:hypothetical protein